jgi:hypothetical protein
MALCGSIKANEEAEAKTLEEACAGTSGGSCTHTAAVHKIVQASCPAGTAGTATGGSFAAFDFSRAAAEDPIVTMDRGAPQTSS